MLNALKKGDRIVTIGGIHGTIQKIKDASVIVRVDENTKMEFSRSAISSVEAAADNDSDEAEEKSGEKNTEKGGGEKS
jgi:preprotein translocase subunit YajC